MWALAIKFCSFSMSQCVLICNILASSIYSPAFSGWFRLVYITESFIAVAVLLFGLIGSLFYTSPGPIQPLREILDCPSVQVTCSCLSPNGASPQAEASWLGSWHPASTHTVALIVGLLLGSAGGSIFGVIVSTIWHKFVIARVEADGAGARRLALYGRR